jgi:hypothetical protein
MVVTQEEKTKVVIGLEKPNIHEEGRTQNMKYIGSISFGARRLPQGKNNFLVGCLCMFLFHHTNMVEM